MLGNIVEELMRGIVIGDGGYLLELERRGYVKRGAGQEKGKQFTPEVAIERPEALRELHREFLLAGSQVLQALTFFASREKLTRAGYGSQTEAINHAAVKIAREVAGDRAWVAGTVSRTQLFEREGSAAAKLVRDLFTEQIRILTDAGVDFLILETFFRVDEMRIALECARVTGLPIVATMSFRPNLTSTADGHSLSECAKILAGEGARSIGANCEQEPARMLPILRVMREAVDVPIAAQPAAFRTTDRTPCFCLLPQFPDEMETVQVSRREFFDFAVEAKHDGFRLIGGCCGANAAYIRAMAEGLASG
jgi:betaine-homocysteine S-methyltransferase